MRAVVFAGLAVLWTAAVPAQPNQPNWHFDAPLTLIVTDGTAPAIELEPIHPVIDRDTLEIGICPVIVKEESPNAVSVFLRDFQSVMVGAPTEAEWSNWNQVNLGSMGTPTLGSDLGMEIWRPADAAATTWPQANLRCSQLLGEALIKTILDYFDSHKLEPDEVFLVKFTVTIRLQSGVWWSVDPRLGVKP